MPKQQQQGRDLELDRLVRQSPLHTARTPSPSTIGTSLDLPNVPSYPRLPPINPSNQLSGLSNPAFHIEDERTSARPSGDLLRLKSLVASCIAKYYKLCKNYEEPYFKGKQAFGFLLFNVLAATFFQFYPHKKSSDFVYG